jgi:sugar phosphate isomerase/epimerase
MKYSMCLSVSPAKFEAVPFKRGFDTDVHVIKQLGFDGVELAVRDPSLIDQEEILKTTKALGLAISAIGTGQAWGEEGLSYTDPEADIRRKAIDRTCSHFPFAGKAKAVVIIGLLRGTRQKGVSEQQLDEWMYAAFSECCNEAESQGVRIAFEPLNRYETSLLNSVEEGLAFIDKIGSPSLGMLLDTFHMNIEEPSIEKSIKLAGNRMFHFHYADSNRNYPGDGHLDFASILCAVQEVGYRGYVSGEHRAFPEPDVAASRGLSYLKELEKTLV